MTEFEEMSPGDEIQIDFDVVAKKEDLDLLRSAVLEILKFVRATDSPNISKVIGPACAEMLKRNE